ARANNPGKYGPPSIQQTEAEIEQFIQKDPSRLLTTGTTASRQFELPANNASFVRATAATPGRPANRIPELMGKVGKALPTTGRITEEAANMRMKQFADMIQGGATSGIGKAIRSQAGGEGQYASEVLGRIGGKGSMKGLLPELEDFSESPGEIAKAI